MYYVYRQEYYGNSLFQYETLDDALEFIKLNLESETEILLIEGKQLEYQMVSSIRVVSK